MKKRTKEEREDREGKRNSEDKEKMGRKVAKEKEKGASVFTLMAYC